MKFHYKILSLFVVNGIAIFIFGIYQIQTLYLSQKNAFQERIRIESTIVQRRFENAIDNLKKTVDILQNAQEIVTGILSGDVDLLYNWATLFIPKFGDKIQFINHEGLVIARGDNEFKFGDFVQKQNYFSKALKEGEFIGFDTMDGVKMLIVAARTKNHHGSFSGVIAIGLALNDEFYNNLALGTHMGILEKSFNELSKETDLSSFKPIPFNEISHIAHYNDTTLFMVLKTQKELDTLVDMRTNLLIGFLIVFIFFVILVNAMVFRYLRHYNTLTDLLFDFYENKISIDHFVTTIKKTILVEKTCTEINKMGELFLKIVQKMSAAQDHFQRLSQTDELTKIANRRKLDDMLELKLKEARRGVSLSIIVLDIDDFKKINDTYGHDIGDVILQQFASILQENIRETDIVGRWGGEEFLMILPTTANAGAVSLADALRVKIESYQYTLGIKVTASFGVATYQSDDTERSLIKRVDDALYRAKNLGKNRVENEIF